MSDEHPEWVNIDDDDEMGAWLTHLARHAAAQDADGIWGHINDDIEPSAVNLMRTCLLLAILVAGFAPEPDHARGPIGIKFATVTDPVEAAIVLAGHSPDPRAKGVADMDAQDVPVHIRMAGQLVTATFNDDDDTAKALLNTLLDMLIAEHKTVPDLSDTTPMRVLGALVSFACSAARAAEVADELTRGPQ